MKSLRAKLLLFLISITLLTSSVVAALFYIDSRSNIDISIDKTLIEAEENFKDHILNSQSIKNRIESENIDPNTDLQQDYSFRFGREFSGFIIEIFNKEGQLIASPQGNQLLIPSKILGNLSTLNSYKIVSASIEDEEFKVLISPIGDGNYLLLARALKERDYFLSHNIRFLILLLFLAVFLSIFSGFFISRRLTDRLSKLTKVAQKVTLDGNLGERVSFKGDDEISKLAEAINIMLERVAIGKEEQARLIDHASHELKTPLTSLITNIELLQLHPNLDKETKEELFKDINSSLNELKNLVEEVLNLGSGTITAPELEKVSLVEDISAILKSNTHFKTMNFNLTGEENTVLMARSDLKRIVDNLIENTFKYSHSKNVDIMVIDNGFIFQDEGEGFSTRDLEFATENFYRGSDKQGIPGSGLGLAIVKYLVGRYQGEIKLGNGSNGGAQITVLFNSRG